MKINMRKWMLDMSMTAERKAMPIMTYPGLELSGMTVLDIVKHGESQFKCMQALAERFPSAAAVTTMDLSVEAEAYGSEIRFSDNEVPSVVNRLVYDEESINALKNPNVGDGRTGEYIKAAKLAAMNIDDRPTFAGQIGPFSLAGRLYDMTEIMVSILLEPEMIHVLLEKVTEFLIEYAKAYKESGANGIIMAEPAAGLLSPEQCEEFSSRYVRKIVEAVQDDYFMVILHNCGNTIKLVSSMVGTGAMAFHFGNAVDMRDILPQIPSERLAFGNVNPAVTFKAGTADDVRDETEKLLNNTVQYKNFVISSGCDIPPQTPIKNIEAFFAAVGEYNRRVLK